ncbi:hypothetical protein LIER_21538 [Lithospermum erythrorhizon]|uniref:Retrotransposon gag domain-containing protein n=1 Tax=Lithospermum erythrorhizon TaxID=34254 RepID=A0AAV3QRT7_LITER
MTRSHPFGELLFDPEIEKTARKLNTENRWRKAESSYTMADDNQDVVKVGNDGANFVVPRITLRDYALPTLEGLTAHMLRPPPINANNFELKPALIQHVKNHVQFSCLGHEDPNEQLVNFMEIAATLKVNGVPADSIHRLLFPFSLSGRAKEWWNAQIPANVTTWEQVVQKFLARYFPASKSTKLKNDIVCFQQDEDEMVGEAWERFQGLLRKCPNHSFPRPYLVQTFHNGLTPSAHTILDVSAGGAFDKKETR